MLPPYLGEMGYEVKYHLARVEPWLRNGWKILARRPEFYPPGTVVESPEFFEACDVILGEHLIVGAGAGIYRAAARTGRPWTSSRELTGREHRGACCGSPT